MDRKRKIDESQPRADLEKRPRTIGPALPPGEGDQSGSDSDSSDDDFGPSLPPADGAAPAADDGHSKSKELPEEPTEAPGPKTGQRDSWMLQPPDSSDWSSRVDPTKLRSRGFQTGRSARGQGQGAGKEVDSSWTETPQEKMNRLQDQVMGVAAPTAGGQETAAEESKKADMMRERIQKYNKETRESSPSDSRKPKKDKEEDDPSKRAFDREKDMSLSSRISNAQRREMVNRASDFGSRFSGGKFL